MTKKRRVALFGASGTMGFQAFKELWRRRDEFDISILVLPSERGDSKFRKYELAAGLKAGSGTGVVEGNGLRIVWGDATDPEATAATIASADAVLNATAYISPAADYRPEMAWAVNVDAVALILQAIAAEPGGNERIRYVHTGSVAQTGNRPVGVHVGRVGDPMRPSVFDTYALTKIAGERLVLESDLRLWASLRLTFIMPSDFTELFGLLDPIVFHMPLDARMETITDRAAGIGLVNTLDVADDADFWRRAYNMGGGAAMRTTAHAYLTAQYAQLGARFEVCAERNWFALRNFHMQYYEDSHITNGYLDYQYDTLESHAAEVWASMPLYLRALAGTARKVPLVRGLVERTARARLGAIARGHGNSPLYWHLTGNGARVQAFYGGAEAFEAIPGWGDGSEPPPHLNLDPEAPWRRFDHGYDETKPLLDLHDLQESAAFRGGECLSTEWSGDPYAQLDWVCAVGHTFSARAYTTLGAGHWCPVCVEDWNGHLRANRDHHFGQAWYSDHSEVEEYDYSAVSGEDIRDADLVWSARRRPTPPGRRPEEPARGVPGEPAHGAPSDPTREAPDT